MSRPYGLVPRVCQSEAARAVGVFQASAFHAQMSEQRRLLVPRDAEDGHALAEKGLCRDAVVMSRRINLGQHNARNAEQPQKLVVPRQGMNIEQHGARSVCIVSGKDFSLAQMPHE